MKKIAFAAIGLLACVSVSQANVAQDVALAAETPAVIPGMVKTLEKQDVPDFVAKLVKVLAAKPASPTVRVKGLVDASKLVFSNVGPSELGDAIVASAANVPFNALPEWTRLCKRTTKAITANMADPQYDAIVDKVIKDIADLSSVSQENKAVVTICALELLARGKGAADDQAWLSALSIPAGYRQDVVDGFAAMSRGDYASLFGNTKIIKIDEKAEVKEEPADVADVPADEVSEKKAEPQTANGNEFRLVDPTDGPNPKDTLVPGAENLPDTKVGAGGTGATGDMIAPYNIDRPSPVPAVKPAPVPPKPSKPSKPVVPTPYKGQF